MEFDVTDTDKGPNSWRLVPIEEIGEVMGGGTPSTKKEEYYNGDIAWITPKDLSRHRKKRISKGGRNITKEGLNKSSAKLMPKNTVLLSSRAPIGYVAIADNELSTNQGFKSIICDKEKVIPDYLYYVLKTSKNALEAISSGSTFKEVSGKAVKAFKIPLPPMVEQLKISNILSALDNKIELNNEMSSYLEQLALTLFKRWFVDFEFPNENGEPYKSSGGEMVESGLGMIPRNWYVGSLNNLGEIVGGGTPSRKNEDFFTGNEISWITPKDLSNDKSVYIYKGATDITEEGLKKSSAKLHPENTVLFSSRAPIGYVAIAGKRMATNQGFKSIVPFEGIPSEYIYTLLKTLTSEIEANAGGSTFKEISGAGMKGIKISVPSLEVLGSYHKVIMTVFNKIKSLEKENRILIDLRDMLLPKLLSEEIKIPDETEVTENVPIS